MSHHDSQNRTTDLRFLIALVYFPTLLMYIGWGMIIPVVPLFARELGAGLAMAGIVVSFRGAAPVLFNIPAGMLISRFGNRPTLIAATILAALTALATGLSRNIAVLAVATFILGGTQITWNMSRLAFIRSVVPVEVRGRAISAIGGIVRIGTFIGPIIGGYIGKHAGLPAVFFAQAAVVGIVLVTVSVRRKHVEPAPDTTEAPASLRAVLRMFKTHAGSFLTVGMVTVAFGIVRSARQIIFPLWGESISIDVAQIGLVVGLSSAVDMLFFYPAGLLMDRKGRKWAAVPSLLTMSVGLALLPAAETFAAVLLVGLVIGLGNGFGSGIVMTMGSDLAPDRNTGEFLGLWFLVANTGAMIGPLVIGGLAEGLSLGLASLVTAGLGVAGVLFLLVFVQETRTKPSA